MFSARETSQLLPPSHNTHLYGDRNSLGLIRRLWQSDTHWVLLLLLFNLAFFGDALFTDKTFFVRDVSFFHYPLKRLVTEAYSNGEWPLWNPYIQLGQPLLANPNSMALYPTQILFQFLPFEMAFDLHFALHCMLAGIATFYLARAAGLSGHSAFLSAGIYNFSGVTLSFVNIFNILPVVALLPLLTLALMKTLQGFSLWRLAGASFIFAAFFLLLEPLSSMAAALFLIPFLSAFYFCSPQPKIPALKTVASVVIIVISGLLLASLQIIPTLELIQYSGRKSGLDFDVASFWSWHPVSCLQLIFSRPFGEYFRMAQPAPWGNVFFDNREPYLLSCYVGMFALLLGLSALFFSSKRWLTNTLIGISLIAVLLALGKYIPTYSWLYQHFPLFQYGRFPVKYLYVANLCFALLAGLGLDGIEAWRDGRASKSNWGKIGILVTMILLLITFSIGFSTDLVWRNLNLGDPQKDYLAVRYHDQVIKISKSIIYDALTQAQFHLGAFVLFLVLIRSKRIRLKIIRIAVLAFIFFDLFISNFWINPLIRADFYDPAPAALFLKDQVEEGGYYRIYAFEEEQLNKETPILGDSDSVAWVSIYRKLTLFQLLAAKDHVQYSVFKPIDRLETFQSLLVRNELARLQTLEEKLNFLSGLNVGFILSPKEIKSPLLSLVDLFELNSSQPLRIYKLVNALPRAFFADPLKPQDFNRTHLNAYAGASGDRSSSVLPRFVANETNPGDSHVRITRYTPNRVEIEATSDRKCLLVLLDSYYPGWQAKVDGQETQVNCINQVFRGIEFPSGRHHVTFSYKPGTFFWGLWISLISTFGWAVVLLFSYIPSKHTVIPRHAQF